MSEAKFSDCTRLCDQLSTVRGNLNTRITELQNLEREASNYQQAIRSADDASMTMKLGAWEPHPEFEKLLETTFGEWMK